MCRYTVPTTMPEAISDRPTSTKDSPIPDEAPVASAIFDSSTLGVRRFVWNPTAAAVKLTVGDSTQSEFRDSAVRRT